ncbi:response regulator [Breoghania sp.]|uniref:response regulator n=1 Tax=Breoghania sp. TaxID=2065378 RepID=UPI0029C8FC53|nr:response regulator [Breoghania sp.]
MMHRKKILIVDPSPNCLRQLKEAIETYETLVDVSDAPDAKRAREVLRKHLPDIAFIEVDMPLDDGLALIRSIRRLAPDSRIVVLTGNVSEDCRIQSREHGANDHFYKEAVTGIRLVDFIHEIIRR